MAESLIEQIKILQLKNRQLQIELDSRDEDKPISYEQQIINIKTAIIQRIENLIHPWKEILSKEATLSAQILLALPQIIASQQLTKTQAEPLQVREGRWLTRGYLIKNVRHNNNELCPWSDGELTWFPDGSYVSGTEDKYDLMKYLGPI